MRTLISVAGDDPGVGVRAGLQADAEIARWMGVHFLGVIAVDTEQDESGLRSVRARAAEEVEENLQRALVESVFQGEVSVKTGALGNAAIVEVVARVMREWPEIPVVVDPVHQASRKHAHAPDLLDSEGWQLMCAELFPVACLVTPNAKEFNDGADYRTARAVLVTGGDRAQGKQVFDTLHWQGEERVFRATRLPGGEKLHGTGCRLASAIACSYLERGDLLRAIEHGRAVLRAWMQSKLGESPA
jgi:hydroxymethylpyrimidine/phosphomethylpyrimidine kinase